MEAGAGAPTARPGVEFDVESFGLEDGRIVVTGRWSGVRGLRFIRPTLLVGERQVLAALDHKPWAPGGDDPWTAAFPWDGEPVDAADVTLVVAPSVTVPLAAAPARRKATPRKAAARKAAAVQAPPPAPPAAPPAEVGARVGELGVEVRALREELESATRQREALARDLAATARARDVAVEQRDEAVRDLEAAIRTRERMEGHRDAALRAREVADEARDEATRQRDEARAQRDEALLGYETLERRLASQLAADDPAPRPEAGADEPIGVRSIPAARSVAPRLTADRRPGGLEVSNADVWAIRILGSVAAVCFILLLVALLRVFL